MFVVAGSTGNTGSVVASRLLSAGKKVRAIGRTSERLQSISRKGAEPFVADLTDREALAQAFTGADGVYIMLPPDPSGPDFRAHQEAITEAVASALEHSHVKHAVTLSSIGADKPDRTGPVVALHRMEERLNRISGLNVLHLRAGYFMENTLMQAQMIHNLNVATGPVLPELKLPMIAARDIGEAAATALLNFDFNGHQVRELQGPRDITMHEVASIIGRAIGKPDLKYVQASDDQARAGMLQSGMPADLVRLILEMAVSLNSGYMKALEPRSARNTTPTTYETFVQQEFLPVYRGSKVAA